MSSLRALALFRSNCPAYRQGIERVAMYMAHFGVPYRALDLAYEALPGDLTAYPLDHRQPCGPGPARRRCRARGSAPRWKRGRAW